MDQKKQFISLIKNSELDEGVKEDLIKRAEAGGMTEDLINEAADILDFQAEIFKTESGMAKDQLDVLSEFSGKLEDIDKEQNEALSQVAEDAERELNELEQKANNPQNPNPAPQGQEVTTLPTE